MTRGKILLITDDRILSSIEFNGDMYPSGYGEEVVEEILKKVSRCNVGEFKKFVRHFDENYFGYVYEGMADPEMLVFKKKKEDRIDLSDNYFKNYGSDYIYMKNVSNEAYPVTDINGRTQDIFPGQIKAYYFGIEKKIET